MRENSCTEQPIRRQILLLLAVASLLAMIGNAVHPGSLGWTHDWSADAHARVLAHGFRVVSLREVAHASSSDYPTILDARVLRQYTEAHIPNALPAPWPAADLVAAAEARRRDLHLPLIIYCSSAQCDAALLVASAFKRAGFESIGVFFEGFDHWETGNHPVEGGMPEPTTASR